MPKVRVKWAVAGITVAALLSGGGVLAYGASHAPPRHNSAVFAAPVTVLQAHTAGTRKTVNAGVPVRLKIPTIGVDAALERTWLTPQGDLGAPKEPANAGWYDQGPRPGDSGNAIIDGHFGYRNHIPAVFDNLHTLQPGDNIYVEDEDGVTTTFVVRAIQTVSPDEDTAAVFRPSDGDEHLNLITCQGTWNASQKSYTARLVVFADKQDAQP